MSFDYFSKRRMQYFLEKLKDIFDTKVDKVIGKGLSTNDYTTTEKNKLAGIATGAEVNVQSDWNQTTTTADDYIKNKPTIPAAQVNSNWNATSGVAQILNKPTLATVATSGSYNDLSNKPTIPDISTKVSKSGDTMSGDLTISKANPKITLTNSNSVAVGTDVPLLSANYKNSTSNVTMSVNPISIIGTDSSDGYNTPVRLGSNNGTTIVGAGESSTTFASKQSKYNDETLYLVADGDIKLYKSMVNDGSLGNGPYEAAGFSATPTNGQVVVADGTRGGIKTTGYTIAKSVPSDAKFTDTTYGVVSKTANGLAPQLPNETTTTKFLRQDGSWAVPSYPTVNNGTLTIQKNGTNVQTFTANQSGNATANITVPTKVSELTNDSGYTKNTGTVTSVATGTGLTGGPITGSGTISTYLPRVAKDSKVFPGANKIIWEEYTSGDNYNLPSNAWYHIISMQGTDTKYGTQLALGMTTEAAYYRNYNNGTWGNWRSLINTNTTYSANNGVGLSGTTFYNSGIRDISINGNYLRKNLNGTNTDLTIPYATTSGSSRITSQVSQVGSDAASSDGWYKVASGTLTGYSNVSLMFAVHNTADFNSGILLFDLRCDNLTSLTVKKFGWLVRYGYTPSNFIVNTNGNNWAIYQNITRTQYYRDTWTVLEESSTSGKQASYTLNNSTTKESTVPTRTATSVDLGFVSNAYYANKLGSSTVGSARQAIYLNAGTATAGNYTVAHMGNAAKSNMNDIGRLYPSTGMTSLSDPGNNYDNPMNGTTKSTSWHHYWNTSYSDDPNGSNSWVTQMCNKAGTNQWWVRSRSGGTITNGTAWNAPWEHLVVSPQAGQGGTTTPIYIDANGHTQNCGYTIAKSVPSNAVFTDTNNAVTQTASDDITAKYEVLFSVTADNTTRTEGARKSSKLIFDPGFGHLALGSNFEFTTTGKYSLLLGDAATGSGKIKVNSGYGNIAYGSIDSTSANAYISTANSGTVAGGYINSSGTGHILASSKGASATGCIGSGSYSIEATGQGAHAEGYVQSDYGKSITATNYGSHAEGCSTTSSGIGSHCEGGGGTASGTYAHCEGGSGNATGQASHVEGTSCQATASNAHAEGRSVVVNGACSHGEGVGITVPRANMHVRGNTETKKFATTSISTKGDGYVYGEEHFAKVWAADGTIDGSYGSSGEITGTATVTINCQTFGMYLLCVSSFNASTGAFYGNTVRFVTINATANSNVLNLGQSTNAPCTITAMQGGVKLKNTSNTYVTEYTLIRVA